MKFFTIPILLLFLFSLTCCSSGQDYMVSIVNLSASTINDAHVIYDGFVSVGGVIPTGGVSSHLSPEVPIPIKAIVQWRTQDGELHKKEAEVKKLIQKIDRVEIIFEIADNNQVTVKIEPWE